VSIDGYRHIISIRQATRFFIVYYFILLLLSSFPIIHTYILADATPHGGLQRACKYRHKKTNGATPDVHRLSTR
jgi:hypothetical protein